MKARQKNKQAKKYDASLSKAQREFISQCKPIPGEILDSMIDILNKAQENREKEANE